MKNEINAIGDAWELDGFLGLIRNHFFDSEKGQEFLRNLRAVSFDDEDCIPKDYVSILWYVAIFLEWQSSDLKNVLKEPEFKEFSHLSNEIHNELERILGTP